MTREEHLTFCRKCLNRKMDMKQGIICKLTDQKAAFEKECPDFKIDDTVEDRPVEEVEESTEEAIHQLDEQSIDKLRIHQDFNYAIVGGLSATLISAVIWAIITVATKYQIGYMAIGVGLIVGFSVQFFGAGIDKKFGFIGALLSLIGCLLGNLFSQIGFIAEEYSLGYFETLTYLDFSLIVEIMSDSFQVMDIFFYGIAVVEGYKFAFRRVTAETIIKLKSDDYEGSPPSSKLRLPLVIGCFVVLALFFYQTSKGVSGFKTYYYESGVKMSEGELKNNKEEGKWTYWYENENPQTIGHYTDGIPDNLWQWFNEDGELISIGNYKKGMEHGLWMDYYKPGILSDSGYYYETRMDGPWTYWYESGSIYQTGYFSRNKQDSIWTTYFENGQISSIGKMKEGDPIGEWNAYYPNGQLAEVFFHTSTDPFLINNVWDINGNQLVTDGIGIYKSFSDDGQVLQSGEIKYGKRVGMWNSFFENGNLSEEGKFENDTYYIINSWDLLGTQNVKDGSGIYYAYYSDGVTKLQSGVIKNGQKDGLWTLYYEYSGDIFQEENYVNGQQTGIQRSFSESGQILSEGEMIDGSREGEWTWYNNDGTISSSVIFENDKKTGTQTMWSEIGEKTKEEYYEDGVLVSEKILN